MCKWQRRSRRPQKGMQVSVSSVVGDCLVCAHAAAVAAVKLLPLACGKTLHSGCNCCWKKEPNAWLLLVCGRCTLPADMTVFPDS
jgi:hypothetical protein